MFRDEREAALQQLEALQREVETLRADNSAMRAEIVRERVGPQSLHGANYYMRDDSLISPGERVALSAHRLTDFPVWAAVLLHILTLGMFSIFHFNGLHNRLPRGADDDPSTARGAGFSFIPYFHFVWIIFNSRRLAERVNLQYRIRRLPPPVSRSYLTFAAVLSTIPYINLVLGTVAWIYGVVSLQQAVNDLVAMHRTKSETLVRVGTLANESAAIETIDGTQPTSTPVEGLQRPPPR